MRAAVEPSLGTGVDVTAAGADAVDNDEVAGTVVDADGAPSPPLPIMDANSKEDEGTDGAGAEAVADVPLPPPPLLPASSAMLAAMAAARAASSSSSTTTLPATIPVALPATRSMPAPPSLKIDDGRPMRLLTAARRSVAKGRAGTLGAEPPAAPVTEAADELPDATGARRMALKAASVSGQGVAQSVRI